MERAYLLKGAIAPKARPRRGKNGSMFLPENYRNWKNDAIAQLIDAGLPEKPIEACQLEVILIGKHSRCGDADNTIGSILDALVQSGVLIEDNMNKVSKISCELVHWKGLEPQALVLIKPIPNDVEAKLRKAKILGIMRGLQ